MQAQIRNFRRHLRLAFVVPLLLALMLGTVLTVQTFHLRNAMRDVQQSYQVQIRTRSLLKLLLEMETAERGYLLTGEEPFLQPYRNSEPLVKPALEELTRPSSNDSQQQGLLSQIANDYGHWHAFATRMIEMRERLHPVTDVDSNLLGKQLMDAMRASTNQLLQVDESHLEEQLTQFRKTLAGMFATMLSLSLFTGLVVATFSRQELAWVARSFDKTLATEEARTNELHQSQIWLGAVLASIGDGVLATDEEGVIVFSNPLARQILETTQEQLHNSRTSESLKLLDEYTRKPLSDPYPKVMKNGAPYKLPAHTVLVRANGKEVPVEVSAFPIRNDHVGVTGAVIVLRDLTEQRQSERTLQSTEKMATMGRIAATVAHEIHNPLDAIGNLLYLLENSSTLDPASKNYVCLAQEELERVANISEQMLTFSREARQPVEVNVAEVVQNVFTLFDARLKRTDVKVVKEFDSTLCIKALPGEIRQVFSNLIGNALDAMNGAGKLRVRIEESRNWADGARGVRVLVADTGGGIPGEVRGHLMEAFVTSKGEKGTGLGLWVCRGIVEKYHGTLRYHTSTKAGRSGTTFSVFVPADLAAAAKPMRLVPEERAS